MEPRKVFLETPVIFVPRRDSRERAPHGKRLGRMHEQGRHVGTGFVSCPDCGIPIQVVGHVALP